MSVNFESLARHLEGLARSGETAYYTDLTRLYDLPPPFPNWKGHILSELFALLDEDDARANRPFRTAMVIRDDGKGLPGPGFFSSLYHFKRGVLAKTMSDKKRLHSREKDGVIALYQSSK